MIELTLFPFAVANRMVESLPEDPFFALFVRFGLKAKRVLFSLIFVLGTPPFFAFPLYPSDGGCSSLTLAPCLFFFCLFWWGLKKVLVRKWWGSLGTADLPVQARR